MLARRSPPRASLRRPARVVESRPGFGIVTWHTEGRNQHGELVGRLHAGRNWRAKQRRFHMTASGYLTDERLGNPGDPARQFAMAEVLPLANETGPQEEPSPRLSFAASESPMGYFDIMIGREFGGMGLGVFEYALITRSSPAHG